MMRSLSWVSALVESVSIYGMLCLRRKETTTVGSLRFAYLQARPTEVLDLTNPALAGLH
jgi:hypothetical protein